MSIGLISENEIREKLRREIEKDIKKFLDNGGEITKVHTTNARFWDHEADSGKAYRRGIVIRRNK